MKWWMRRNGADKRCPPPVSPPLPSTQFSEGYIWRLVNQVTQAFVMYGPWCPHSPPRSSLTLSCLLPGQSLGLQVCLTTLTGYGWRYLVRFVAVCMALHLFCIVSIIACVECSVRSELVQSRPPTIQTPTLIWQMELRAVKLLKLVAFVNGRHPGESNYQPTSSNESRWLTLPGASSWKCKQPGETCLKWEGGRSEIRRGI